MVIQTLNARIGYASYRNLGRRWQDIVKSLKVEITLRTGDTPTASKLEMVKDSGYGMLCLFPKVKLFISIFGVGKF